MYKFKRPSNEVEKFESIIFRYTELEMKDLIPKTTKIFVYIYIHVSPVIYMLC